MRKKFSASFSCSTEFLAQLEARAESLGMTRSQYLTQLIRRDLDEAASGAEFRIAEDTKPATPFPAPKAVTYPAKKAAGGRK